MTEVEEKLKDALGIEEEASSSTDSLVPSTPHLEIGPPSSGRRGSKIGEGDVEKGEGGGRMKAEDRLDEVDEEDVADALKGTV